MHFPKISRKRERVVAPSLHRIVARIKQIYTETDLQTERIIYGYQGAMVEGFAFCHKGGIIYISEVIDISPSNLDYSLCFIQLSISHDALCM